MLATSPPQVTWPIIPDDFPLNPDQPVDNDEHYPIAGALGHALQQIPELVQNALITTNFALCAAIDGQTICKGPDWMYVQPVSPRTQKSARRSYTPHREGPVPLIVMEFLSHRDNREYSMQPPRSLAEGGEPPPGDSVGKWYFYERIIQVPYYIIFEPTRGRIEVNRLIHGIYQPCTPDPYGRYPIPEFGLSLGVWFGRREGRTGHWLRWWDDQGQLLLWIEERYAQAEQAREQAEHQAEQEHQRAEQERQAREDAEYQAEQERQAREDAERQADQERQRAERLAERLRALGLDHPDSGADPA